MASKSGEKPKEKNAQPAFQWSSEMIDHLILCLKDYKTAMDYKNVDFNSDVVAMYSKLCEGMALAFDAEYFGPVDLPEQDSEELSKTEENAFSGALMTGSKKLVVSSALGVSSEIRRKISAFFFATWRRIYWSWVIKNIQFGIFSKDLA